MATDKWLLAIMRYVWCINFNNVTTSERPKYGAKLWKKLIRHELSEAERKWFDMKTEEKSTVYLLYPL